jgi:hypothetical protein
MQDCDPDPMRYDEYKNAREDTFKGGDKGHQTASLVYGQILNYISLIYQGFYLHILICCI